MTSAEAPSKTRNFARADGIRNDLAAKGILLEDSKDGVRWKRKSPQRIGPVK